MIIFIIYNNKIMNARESEYSNLKISLLPNKIFNLKKAIEICETGKYQIKALVYLGIIWFTIPTIPIMLPFWRSYPSYNRNTTNKTPNFDYCKEYTSNPVNSKIRNLETDFKLNCIDNSYYGYLASTYLLGVLIGFLFISNMANIYGRKAVMSISLQVYIIVLIIMILNSRIEVLFFLLLVIGIIYSGASMCAYVLIYESIKNEDRTLFTTLISMSYSIGALINIIVFYFLQNWLYIICLNLFVTSLLFLCTDIIAESPEFLYSENKHKQLNEVLLKIANDNGVLDKCEHYLKIYPHTDRISENKKENTFGVWELLKYQEIRLKIAILCFNWFVMTLTFYGMNFNLDRFYLSPYITGNIVYISEALAQFISMFLIEKFGDKFTIFLNYSVTGLSLIILNFITHKSSDFDYLKIILIFLAKFGVSAITNVNYIYTARLFSTKLRISSMSLCKIISRLGGIISTILFELSSYSLLIMGLMCISIPLLINLYDDTLEQIN
jgi:MFS family permease